MDFGDNIDGFSVEAGLNNLSELSLLGVDIEDNRNQRLIAERHQAQQLQQNSTERPNVRHRGLPRRYATRRTTVDNIEQDIIKS